MPDGQDIRPSAIESFRILIWSTREHPIVWITFGLCVLFTGGFGILLVPLVWYLIWTGTWIDYDHTIVSEYREAHGKNVEFKGMDEGDKNPVKPDEMEETIDTVQNSAKEITESSKDSILKFGSSVNTFINQLAKGGMVILGIVILMMLVAVATGVISPETTEMEQDNNQDIPAITDTPVNSEPVNPHITDANVDVNLDFGRNPVSFKVRAITRGHSTLKIAIYDDEGITETSLDAPSQEGGIVKFEDELLPPESLEDDEQFEITFVLSVDGEAVDTRTIGHVYSE
jgi:hypothetical protein